jgi:hypothetical protein
VGTVTEGTAVGTGVEVSEGSGVSSIDGEEEGVFCEGAAVGSLDGRDVGATVGASEGAAVGDSVGAEVVAMVGNAVGALVPAAPKDEEEDEVEVEVEVLGEMVERMLFLYCLAMTSTWPMLVAGGNS